MNVALNPERFTRPDLQETYEEGYQEERDHDSLALIDRFSWMPDEADAR